MKALWINTCSNNRHVVNTFSNIFILYSFLGKSLRIDYWGHVFFIFMAASDVEISVYFGMHFIDRNNRQGLPKLNLRR